MAYQGHGKHFQVIDEYLKFGKPIHITELGICQETIIQTGPTAKQANEMASDHYLYGDGIWHAEWSGRKRSRLIGWNSSIL